MVKAVIDLGTNSLKCLIAATSGRGYRIIEDISRVCKLGRDLATTGNIGPAAMDDAIAVLREFKTICNGYDATQIVCVGAETLRKAGNSTSFIELVKMDLGLHIQVLSPRQEAFLTFQASAGLIPDGESGLVIDSGGGSTELSFGSDHALTSSLSLPFGALTLTRGFFRNDPPGEGEISALRNHVILTLGQAVSPKPGITAIACGGSITTMATVSMGLKHYNADLVQGYYLEMDEVSRQVGLFGGMSAIGRSGIRGMQPGREDIILAGALIYEELMRYFGLQGMTVSTYGIRHALMFTEHGDILQTS
jgi:exopolyphosphatase/guanosine-5'-triphosphate,3'-diphosphate pyrophosphatase